MYIYIYTHPNLLGVIALVIAISNLNCTPKELQEEIEAKDQDIEKGGKHRDRNVFCDAMVMNNMGFTIETLGKWWLNQDKWWLNGALMAISWGSLWIVWDLMEYPTLNVYMDVENPWENLRKVVYIWWEKKQIYANVYRRVTMISDGSLTNKRGDLTNLFELSHK